MASGATDPAKTAKATAAVLQLADLPPGYKALTPEDGGGLNIDKLWTDLKTCIGATTQTVGTATSPTFITGLATQARTTVEYTTDVSATALAAAIAGPKTIGCLTTIFTADVKATAPPGVIPGPLTAAQLSVVPAIAPKTTVFRMNNEMSLSDAKFPLVQDLVISYAGGAVIRALFLNTGGEFRQDLERTVVTKVIGRV